MPVLLLCGPRPFRVNANFAYVHTIEFVFGRGGGGGHVGVSASDTSHSIPTTSNNPEQTMRFSALRRAAVFAAPVLLLSLQEVAHAADLATEDGVLIVTGETIDQAIKDHSHLVVEFYAPCKFR